MVINGYQLSEAAKHASDWLAWGVVKMKACLSSHRAIQRAYLKFADCISH